MSPFYCRREQDIDDYLNENLCEIVDLLFFCFFVFLFFCFFVFLFCFFPQFFEHFFCTQLLDTKCFIFQFCSILDFHPVVRHSFVIISHQPN
jgi:hypothetical protein